MQVSCFPTFIKLTVSQLSDNPSLLNNIRVWRLAILALTLLFGAMAANLSPVTTSFDPMSQIADNTMSFKVMTHMQKFNAMVYPVYGLHRNDLYPKQWNGTSDQSKLGALDIRPLLVWPQQFELQHESFDRWIKEPYNSIMFLPFIEDEYTSTLYSKVLSWPSSDAERNFEFLEQLHALSSNGSCYTSFDALGGYTVHTTYHNLAYLAVCSIIVSTGTTVMLAGRRGVLALVALLITYVGVAMFISSFKIVIDLMVIAVLLIAPGVVIDYSIHLIHDPSANYAVFLSALTSVVSMCPFASTSVQGIRNFSGLYIAFIGIGMLSSMSVCRTNYVPVSQDDANAQIRRSQTY
jgi:hypothetical protein